MFNLKHLILFLTLAVGSAGCSSTDILRGVESVFGGGGSGSVSNTDIIGGLKQALSVGITKGATNVSKTDGFFKNANIKIPFPPEVQKVENTLRDLGMSNLVDKVVLSLNRGAEEAAKSAKPIFVDAIKNMTISDAMNILKGPDNAATSYLEKTSSNALRTAFMPVIKTSLEKVNATKYWGDVTSRYNKIPLVKPVNESLDDYVTQKALEGLFFMVEKEEAKIRKDPLARSTDLLKKVFKLQDS